MISQFLKHVNIASDFNECSVFREQSVVCATQTTQRLLALVRRSFSSLQERCVFGQDFDVVMASSFPKKQFAENKLPKYSG